MINLLATMVHALMLPLDVTGILIALIDQMKFVVRVLYFQFILLLKKIIIRILNNFVTLKIYT